MARIAGVDLPRDKRVEIGLTYIYGIGRKTATDIIAATPKKTYQNSENISTIIAALKVISVVISLSTSRDLSKSAAIAVFATERVCP